LDTVPFAVAFHARSRIDGITKQLKAAILSPEDASGGGTRVQTKSER
jgi:hypothetical protein